MPARRRPAQPPQPTLQTAAPEPADNGPVAELTAALERLTVQHQGLVDVTELTLTAAGVDDVIQQVLALVRRIMPYTVGAFYWWDAGRRGLRRAGVVGEPHEVAATPLEVTDAEALLSRAVTTRQPLMAAPGAATTEMAADAANATAEIAVPVLVKGSLLGAFTTVRRGGQPFTAADLAFVTQFVRQASIAIENARLLRQIRQSEEQYRSLFVACLDVVYMSTPSGLFLDVNPAGLSLFGYQHQEDLLCADIGTDLYADPHDRDEFQRLMAEQGFVRNREVRLKRTDGQVLTVLETATALRDESGTPIAYRGILRDITERKRAEDALAHQALHDGLTGLPNRTLLHDRLQQAILAASRTQTSAALLLMDLDGFKEVNDTLGHAVGDRLLTEVAHRLQAALRPADTVARLGGDEFAVVLPEADALAAVAAARRLLAAVERPVRLADHGIEVDVRGSIGIAAYPEHGADPDQLLQRADVAMYVAKRTACGPTLYAPDLDDHSPTRLALVGELRRALEEDGLAVYYQPQVALDSGRVVGAEGLVRWPHPRRGLIGPDQFIPLAEQTGLIRPLTTWVLESAVQQCRAWGRGPGGLHVPVAVNLSMRDLQDTTLPDQIAGLLARSGVDPSLLRLEITESMLMRDLGATAEILARLRAIGLQIAIDDFGTGYSSLAYLADLPVDTLKIDRTFVRRLAGRPRHAAIVRSTIELAHTLGLKVIAEGVEDAATWDTLADLGCDTAQGFYLAKPMPATHLTTWLSGTEAPAA